VLTVRQIGPRSELMRSSGPCVREAQHPARLTINNSEIWLPAECRSKRLRAIPTCYTRSARTNLRGESAISERSLSICPCVLSLIHCAGATAKAS